MSRHESKSQDGVLMLELLEAVARDGDKSQRHLASELGVALGLVNAYLKRCVKKGFVKISAVPARRYGYYLTPRGFAEKSRLTVSYLSHSFSFFRQARADCAVVLAAAKSGRYKRIALAGFSDLAEIVLICSLELKVSIVAIVDAKAGVAEFAGVPVYKSFDAVPLGVDAVVVTSLSDGAKMFADARARFGDDRVFAPRLLGLASPTDVEEGA